MKKKSDINVEDWETMRFYDLQKKYGINRKKLYEQIIQQHLYNHRTINERYSMTDLDDYFLRKANNLSVRQLANMFHKSYNAMLIYVKTKGYYERIRSKN